MRLEYLNEKLAMIPKYGAHIAKKTIIRHIKNFLEGQGIEASEREITREVVAMIRDKDREYKPHEIPKMVIDKIKKKLNEEMSSPDNLTAFMEDFKSYATTYVPGAGFYLQDYDVLVNLRPFDGAINLSSIMGNKKIGSPNSVLRLIKRLADKHQVSLFGEIGRFGNREKRLSKAELKRWYKAHGFEVNRHGEIERKPKSI